MIIFLFLGVAAKADLTYWSPTGQKATYILPDSVTPQAYLDSISTSKELAAFTKGMKFQTQDRQIVIKPDSETALNRALLLANSAEDHNRLHPRVDRFGEHFDQTFVVPVGAAMTLNRAQKDKFYRELSKHFGLLVAMGGDDVTTALYGEAKTYAKETIRLRDELEAEIIRHFYFNSNRKLFGVCRGAQLTSVVLGAKLVQDNALELGNKEDHEDGAVHEIKLVPTKHNALASILKSVGTLRVNSYHHQSLKQESLQRTPLQVSAVSPDGIVEAAESIDRRVIVIQSHPEKEDNSRGYRVSFFNALRDWAGISRAKACSTILKAN